MNTLWNWLKRGIELGAWGGLFFWAGIVAIPIVQPCSVDCFDLALGILFAKYFTFWAFALGIYLNMDIGREVWLQFTNKRPIRQGNWIKASVVRTFKKTALLAYWGTTFFYAGVEIQELAKTMYTTKPDILSSLLFNWFVVMAIELIFTGTAGLFTMATAWLSGETSREKRKRKALEQKPHLVIPAAAGLDSELFESYSELLIHLNESKK